MSTLNQAKKVLRIFKQNGFEAYIVGGAVRDHLLKQPLTDVDITTNAGPRKVMKLFKSVPTGFKYGTVTISFLNETFEVTTYRIDQASTDHRHPDDVVYTDEVLEDVKRRDFTINGLLMNDNGDIIDHVEGKKDLENRIIRAIGNPNERFIEDGLRMLRAFYFQSKLGFTIEEHTKQAIQDQAHLLNEISKERVLNELLKILKGNHLKQALLTMIETKIVDYLPGLKQGILEIVKREEMPYIDTFFTLCFALEDEVPLYWPFSNKHRHKYKTASKLANKYREFDVLTVYHYGLDMCLLAAKVNFLLNRGSYQKKEIMKIQENLVIKSELDLALSSKEMMEYVNKKAGAWLGDIKREMVDLILTNQLKNTKEALFQFIDSKGVKSHGND